jgi:AcrR family transcriptional regulator
MAPQTAQAVDGERAATLPRPAPLHVLGEDPAERADARRNRTAVLCAAERLFEAHGVENVSMEAVAAEAGVGKGTLFRRFGDRAGLARALLQESERRLQEGFLHGPPPLGPGAPPQARLKAFAAARLDLLERHSDLIAAAEAGAGGARFLAGPYGVHRLHVAVLVAEADPSLDADFLADALLAPLSAESFLLWHRIRGMSRERMLAGYDTLVDRLLLVRE